MEVNIYANQNRKGLGTTDLFDVIPTGRKGTSTERSLSGGRGVLLTEFNSHIRDAEIKVAVALISHSLQSLNITNVDRLRSGANLETLSDDGQAVYTNSIRVDARDLSALMYKGVRKEGRNIFKALQHLENLTMTYSEGKDKTVIRLFNRVAYKNGFITFDIANFLLNSLQHTFKAFRLAPVLAYDGFTMRLSLHIETNQYGNGFYKDSDGESHQKYFPLAEYYLDDTESRNGLLTVLRIHTLREDKAIAKLKDSFDELNTGGLAKYTYNARRRSFESDYKKGVKKRLIK